ncbi:MAG: SAM-dependent methyltransferase [Rhodobacteraceae bacterium]|nr:SAM-dependent methyltransferase [Paracoccaceae bacterium]
MSLDHATVRMGEQKAEVPEARDAGLIFIGRIETPWTTRAECPKRGDPESGPDCTLVLDPRWIPALQGVAPADLVQVLYWMERARRDLLTQSPRDDGQTMGTFALRSPNRPNPLASSMVRLVAIDGPRLTVRGLDCVSGTPLLDLKPDSCKGHS